MELNRKKTPRSILAYYLPEEYWGGMNWKIKVLVWWARLIGIKHITVTGQEIVLSSYKDSFIRGSVFSTY